MYSKEKLCPPRISLSFIFVNCFWLVFFTVYVLLYSLYFVLVLQYKAWTSCVFFLISQRNMC